MADSRTKIPLGLLLLHMWVAAPAAATWQFYGSGDFGYSVDVGEVSGETEIVPPDPVDIGGKDHDVSPIVAGAVGIQVPMDELTPYRDAWGIRLPDWPVRIELEFAGLREYELDTGPPAFVGPNPEPPFKSNVKTWSMLHNFWLDIPLAGLHRPISSVSGAVAKRQRLPGLKRFLRPASFYLGVGIGFASLEVRTSDGTHFGFYDEIDFAWQVGGGFGYQLTERVNLGVGYRYMRPGTAEMDLVDGVPQRQGSFSLRNDLHEARFSVRILLYDLPYPWR
jgi:hypothetical protein